ncbi:hypothetical protein AKAW_08374 [Aspergillus luchuensis IFO 4308]|nr:hypothetical protein AKAW_08374 [Aspergillus luchuensis IFO 4308]
MGWFADTRYLNFTDRDSFEGQSHEELRNFEPGTEVTEEHKAKFSHELIGGAAAYEAMKAYEEHQEKNGKPDNHAQAKEILAGLAGAFIDREVETKGLDFVDREKAKYHARQQLEQASAQDF